MYCGGKKGLGWGEELNEKGSVKQTNPCCVIESHKKFVGHKTNMFSLFFPQCRASLLLPLPGYPPVTNKGSGVPLRGISSFSSSSFSS